MNINLLANVKVDHILTNSVFEGENLVDKVRLEVSQVSLVKLKHKISKKDL